MDSSSNGNNKSTLLSSFWTEQYRPETLSSGLILNEEMHKVFSKYIEDQEFPHILFAGPPGTGKTTLAMALIKSIIKSNLDVLHINGSVDNGVDNIRESIMSFLATPPAKSNIKIVFIDEADFLSVQAFAALRVTMEQGSTNKNFKTRFIFCANYLNKIPQPILSRFTLFTLNALPKDRVIERCKQILDSEKIKYTNDAIDSIIDQNYPDMRSIVKTLQSSSIDGMLQHAISNTTSYSRLMDDINSMMMVSSFNEAYVYLGRCIEAITTEIDVPNVINTLLEKFVPNPMAHCIVYRYMCTMSLACNNRHTLIALLNELICSRFGMFM